MNRCPDFSIIMPCYQQRRYLEAALSGLLEQGGVSLELIVQDGGSTDGSLELLDTFSSRAPFPVRIESGQDGGQTAALNTGLRKASGRFIAYLNSDDILYPGTLKKIRDAFDLNPDIGLIYGRGDFIDSESRHLGNYPVKPWSPEALLEDCIICQPACFWQRTLHTRLGYFDESLFGAFDYDFWLRASKVCRFQFLDEPLAASRCHADAKTFRYRRRLIEESCRVQARHNGGGISLFHAHELASTRASSHFSLPLPDPIRHLLFVLCFYFYLICLVPRLRPFPDLRTVDSRYLLPDYINARRLFEDPLASVTTTSVSQTISGS